MGCNYLYLHLIHASESLYMYCLLYFTYSNNTYLDISHWMLNDYEIVHRDKYWRHICRIELCLGDPIGTDRLPFLPAPLLPMLCKSMMTSSNGNIFRVTGPLCGEFTGPGEFPAQRPVTRSFDVFFDLHPNKRLSKQWWGWWFETQSCPLWRHRNA